MQVRTVLAAPEILLNRVGRPKSFLRLKRRLADVDVLTLDVFDTALLRSVARPDDVFALAAYRLSANGETARLPNELVAARRAATRAARVSAANRGLAEVTLDEIYDEFLPSWTIEERQAFKREECAAEGDVCIANPEILDLARAAEELNVRIMFISDTPHSVDSITRLLSLTGYGPSPEVITSSAERKTKWGDGALFLVAAARLGVGGGRILHVGDNLTSDILNAKRCGMQTAWYRPRLKRLANPKPADGNPEDLADSLCAGAARLAEDASSAVPQPWRSVGAGCLAPALLSFAGWLRDEAVRCDASRIRFLARDGLIIQRAYELLTRGNDRQTAGTYLYVSRRSLAFPMFQRLGEAELELICQHYEPVRVADIFARIGLAAQTYSDNLAKEMLEPNSLLVTLDDDARMKRCLKNAEESIVKSAQRERILVDEYLAQEGLFDDEGLTILADIGWRGTIQKALSTAICARTGQLDLLGLYFGTNDQIEPLLLQGGRAMGWIEDRGRRQFTHELVQPGWTVLEFLFAARHGTVLGYKRLAGRIEPVLGDVTAEAAYAEAAELTQSSALEMIAHYKRAFGRAPPVVQSGEAALRPLAMLIHSPTVTQAIAIGDLPMAEGFGASWGQAIAKPRWRELAVRPHRAAKAYRTSPWRRGYLTRLLRSRQVVRLVTRTFA